MIDESGVKFNNNSINIYPNLVQNSLHINYTYNDKLIQSYFAIYDITGKKVLSGILIDKEVDTSILENGLYIIVIDSNGQYFTEKFVKL